MVKTLQLKLVLLLCLIMGVGTAWAEKVEYKLTITVDNFNTTSYAANNNEKTSNAICTTDNTKTFEVKWTSNQIMKQNGAMQWQKSKGVLYNSTNLETIKSVTVNATGGSFTTYYGTSAQPSSSTTVGGGYFQIKVGSTTGTCNKIEVVFEIDESGTTPTTYHNLTFNASPADGGTVTVNNSTTSPASIAEGANVNISAEANSGYVFSGWTVTGTGSSVGTANNAATTFTMGTADATLTANFTQVTTHTVTYNANGGTGTTTDANSPYVEGSDVTVAQNKFRNSGYGFVKWNTQPNGLGIDYSPLDQISDINADVVLYAQWEALTYDFGAHSDFSTWGGYATKTLTYPDAQVDFASASKQGTGQDITDQPVTKGGDVELKLTDGSTMSKVTFFCTQWTTKTQTITLHYSTDGGATYTDFDPTVESENFTITKDNLPTGTNAVKITFSSTTNQVGVLGATIVKIANTNPSITASDVNITYDATVGSIAYTLNNEPDPAGTLTAAVVSGGTIANLSLGTSSNGTVSFTCDANTEGTARTATVTLTYTYGNNETVTKNVTITQAAAPMVYSTIQALFDKATEVGNTATDVNVTFDNWIVSGVSTNGKNVFVTDNNGKGFVIYFSTNQSSTFSAGSILTGTAVACKVQKYNGFAEITELNSSDLTITSGGTVSQSTIAMADLAGVNTGALVSYNGLTCSVDNSGSTPKYNLTDGTTTLQVFNSLYAFDALEAGKTYNITGVYQQYNSTKEILPRSTADIEEVAVAPSSTGTITFGNGDNDTKINSASVTGTDTKGNTWTITTEGTTSFTANSAYYQVGSGSKPATSITFTMTLPSAQTITTFEAKFGGFSGTAGNVTLKVGNTTVGTGSLNGTNDVTVTNTSSATGTHLTVTVTNIAKGVKCYYITYTTADATTVPVTIKPGFPATTFSADCALDFTSVSGITAYIITSATGTTSDPLTTVPANTGLYIEGAAGTYNVPVIASADPLTGTNLLEPTTGSEVTNTTTDTYYVYGKQNDHCAFYKVDGSYTPSANKAVLKVTTPSGSAKDFIDVNGGATSIDNIEWTIDNIGANGVYDLQGRRIQSDKVTKSQSNLPKGIYIVNGRKYIVK